MRLFHRLTLVPLVVATVSAFSSLGTGPTGGDGLHFALASSSPAAGATVEAPSELRLTFTEEPEDGTVSIRVLEAEDAGVHVHDPRQAQDDPRTFSVGFHGVFPAGTYTVSWRGMGADGHVVRDTFQFTVETR